MYFEIEYIEGNELKTIGFSEYAEIGYWITNNYETIEIKDIITYFD